MGRPRGLSALAVSTVAVVMLVGSSGRADTDPWTGTPQSWTTRVRAQTPADRYEMAGGCYAIRGPNGYVVRAGSGYVANGSSQSAAEPFFFQATDLGRYLLFDSQETFVAASEGELAKGVYTATRSTAGRDAGGVTYEKSDAAADTVAHSEVNTATGRGAVIVPAAAPGELADWEITKVGSTFSITLPATGQALATGAGETIVPAASGDGTAFTLELLGPGCKAFPEIEINVGGPVYGGANAFEEVRGFMDLHLHMMAYEFIGGRVRCGEPWNRYGVAFALKDCSDSEPNGRGAVLEQLLSGPGAHSSDGWPTFTGWPRYDSLTHEQVYYRWVERAWRGGLRLATVLLVDNHALCVVYPFHSHDCNEMNTIRLEAQRLRELQDYVDAQSGGPGKGWFRIVGDPFEAREIINQGRLAIIPGIETSIPLDCGIMLDIPACNEQQISQRLDEVYNDLGVRQMLILNKFDNAFSGVAGDGGSTGEVVNLGNKSETGNYWRMETCTPSEAAAGATDNLQYNAGDLSGAPDAQAGRDSLAGQILTLASKTGVAPVYPKGPHCNAMGMTALGETMLRELAERHMLFDPDHMSARARRQALNLMNALHYSGVLSSHSWGDDPSYHTIEHMGGVVTPMAQGSTSFLAKWRKYRTAWIDSRFRFGLGWGSDMNGFATQGAPRRPTPEQYPVTYPFDGFPFNNTVSIDHQKSGSRPYDINNDGVAHYGLYPDWIEDLRKLAGSDADEITEDLEMGPEAYLEMWERAWGIAASACGYDVPDITDARIGALHSGMTTREVLTALGQPSSRIGGTFTYCMTDDRTASLEFTSAGSLTSWTVS
jgi:hypothetical protein